MTAVLPGNRSHIIPEHFLRRSTGCIVLLRILRTRAQDLFHDCVERVASRALNTQKVPLPAVTFALTIVAHNVHHALQIGRHGMLGNVPSPGFPSRCHALLTDDRLLADGAPIIKAGKFSETVRMNGVSAGQILRRLARREHVFAAYRTVVLVLVLEALMRTVDADRDAHAALIAMPKGLHSTHPAKATLRTMKGLFRLNEENESCVRRQRSQTRSSSRERERERLGCEVSMPRLQNSPLTSTSCRHHNDTPQTRFHN